MKKHKAIQIYGNGRAYSGKNTLRDWLSPIDPRLPETKTGRKRKTVATKQKILPSEPIN